MKVGIMQPYFFPYLGYISLLKHTDKFILLDNIQFIRHGWIERNRILKQNDGWLYIKVPLIKSGRDTTIKDVRINNSENWKDRILSQIQVYKKSAPYYSKVVAMLNELFSKEYEDITHLNKDILLAVSKFMDIKVNIDIFSEIDLKIELPTMPDEWALNICKALGNVDEYWNPPGGQSFFDRKKYLEANIILKFQKINFLPYKQGREFFEEGLSIIDVMMFNSPDEINIMLDDYELE